MTLSLYPATETLIFLYVCINRASGAKAQVPALFLIWNIRKVEWSNLERNRAVLRHSLNPALAKDTRQRPTPEAS